MKKISKTVMIPTLCLAACASAFAANVQPSTNGVSPAAIAAAQKEAKEELIPSAPGAAVNPMTGRSLSYEAKEHQLRETTLEARIAEQDLAIAKSRAEQRKIASGGTEPRVPDAVRNAQLHPTPKPAAPAASAKQGKGKKASGAAGSVAQGNPAPVQYERPRYVGMFDGADQKVALVSFGGRTVAVGENSSIGNIHVARVTKEAAMINGVTTQLDKSISTIHLPETRQPVQPGTLTAAAATAPMTRGVVVQGVNAPAVQPMAPGAPLSGATTQPVRFPADLYNR